MISKIKKIKRTYNFVSINLTDKYEKFEKEIDTIVFFSRLNEFIQVGAIISLLIPLKDKTPFYPFRLVQILENMGFRLAIIGVHQTNYIALLIKTNLSNFKKHDFSVKRLQRIFTKQNLNPNLDENNSLSKLLRNKIVLKYGPQFFNLNTAKELISLSTKENGLRHETDPQRIKVFFKRIQ